MKKRYDEIMDKVEVTDEMRERILSNLQKVDFEHTPQPEKILFPSMKKILPVAACFAVLLVSSLMLPKLSDNEHPDEILLQQGDYIAEFSTLSELEAAVGFDVPEIDELPFSPDLQIYMAYGSDMAQIMYDGEGQTAYFRKSVGQKDNSGDYNEYAEIEEISVGEVTVTLKGDSSEYTLALWYDGQFSYSLSLSDGLSAVEWEALIAGIE